jgi:hypothetical protein
MDNITKLKELFMLIANTVYFDKAVDKKLFEQLPDGETITRYLDETERFPVTIKHKFIKNYTFEDYKNNEIENYPYLQEDTVIDSINNYYHSYQGIYQILPDNLFDYFDEINSNLTYMAKEINEDDMGKCNYCITRTFIGSLFLGTLIEYRRDFYEYLIDTKFEEMYDVLYGLEEGEFAKFYENMSKNILNKNC